MKTIKRMTALSLCFLLLFSGVSASFATTPVMQSGQIEADGNVGTALGDRKVKLNDTAIHLEGIPEDAEVVAKEVKETQYNKKAKEYKSEVYDILFAYDISLANQDGTEWQPAKGETVTVTLDTEKLSVPEGCKVKILHEHNGKLKALEGEYTVSNDKLVFETDGFSTFYFYLTFEHGDFTYSLSGNEEVYLSVLLSELGLDRSPVNVADVEFSNPDVLEVTKVESDWLLKSLAPFGDKESLTITYSDGLRVDISVTDPVVYNYAVASSGEKKITNVTKLATKNITMATVTNGDTYSQGKKYTTNSTVITQKNIIDAGQKKATSGSNLYSSADTDIVIYVTEGMAVGFEAGTVWPSGVDASRPTHGTNGVWYWSWDSSVNYAVVDDSVKGSVAGKQASFIVEAPSGDDTYYCNIVLAVVEESKPVLLEDALKESGLKGYSIKNFPVTLYNYDGKAWNEHYNAKTGNYFAFSGSSKGVSSTTNAGNRGWTSSGLQANGGGGVALMGILKDTLVNGLPEVSQGQKVDLFSANAVPGKTVYENVDFQFVYNEKTGYYTYNSALNHAQYDATKNEIQLYDQSLAPSDTPNGASHGNGGFYPFEDINKAYTNTGYTDITWYEWVQKLEKNAFELIPSEYSTDIVQTSSTNPASTAELHYGIQFNSDFYLPKDKKLNGQEMIYEFTGDDDLWVYIDGKLVLDIGGGHTYVSGSFNLTTGEVWVEKYTKLAAADGGSYATRVEGTDLRYTDQFLVDLADDQMHTIQVFYLERHAGVSNCRMRYNLPLVPSDSVNVSKNLEDQNSNNLSVTPDTEYTFELYKAKDDGNDDAVNANTFEVMKNAPYTITGTGAPEGTQYTNSETGQFKLKEGWIASFPGIERFSEVYAVEVNPNDGYKYDRTTVSVNKSEPEAYTYGQKTKTEVMQLKKSINFDFVNKMQAQPLTIEKEVVGGTSGLFDSNQKFSFTLDFTNNILEKEENAIKAINKEDQEVLLTDGKAFNLAHGESITVPRVPVNMPFTVKEANPDAEKNSFDKPVFEVTGSIPTAEPPVEEYLFDTAYGWMIADTANKVKIVNQQRFDLVIEKSGIDLIDHHAGVKGITEKEQQTTLFEVTGPNGFKTQIAICGNDKETIKGLPVGEYKVKELNNWSWRYQLDNTVANNTLERIITPDNVVETAEYVNARFNPLWLNGGAYCKNEFNPVANADI